MSHVSHLSQSIIYVGKSMFKCIILFYKHSCTLKHRFERYISGCDKRDMCDNYDNFFLFSSFKCMEKTGRVNV